MPTRLRSSQGSGAVLYNDNGVLYMSLATFSMEVAIF